MPSTVIILPDKKLGHKLTPGSTYKADILKSRFNRAGNLELTVTNIKPVETDTGNLS